MTITIDANSTADRRSAFCDTSESQQNVTHLCISSMQVRAELGITNPFTSKYDIILYETARKWQTYRLWPITSTNILLSGKCLWSHV